MIVYMGLVVSFIYLLLLLLEERVQIDYFGDAHTPIYSYSRCRKNRLKQQTKQENSTAKRRRS